MLITLLSDIAILFTSLADNVADHIMDGLAPNPWQLVLVFFQISLIT